MKTRLTKRVFYGCWFFAIFQDFLTELFLLKSIVNQKSQIGTQP